MNDNFEQTANFFYPPDQCRNKQKFIHSRRLLKPKSSVSNPSTQLTISKRSPNNSDLHIPPPQINEIRKGTQIIRNCEIKKKNNYRILSSNINERSSYPQQISFGNKFLFVNEQKINKFTQSPQSMINKLPDIFNHRNSCQGFKQHYRILSSQLKRDTITNFNFECPKQISLEECLQKLELKHKIQKQKEMRLNNQPISFLQAKQQMKMINRIFSGKRDS